MQFFISSSPDRVSYLLRHIAAAHEKCASGAAFYDTSMSRNSLFIRAGTLLLNKIHTPVFCLHRLAAREKKRCCHIAKSESEIILTRKTLSAAACDSRAPIFLPSTRRDKLKHNVILEKENAVVLGANKNALGYNANVKSCAPVGNNCVTCLSMRCWENSFSCVHALVVLLESESANKRGDA